MITRSKLICGAITTILAAHVAMADQYLAIDLSGGTSATNYPVTYFDSVPVGGWSDEYKTTQLVLRKISAGTFIMGSPTNELGRGSDEVQHSVTLTKDIYIGVFGVTQRQWELVMGNRPSWFNNSTYYATRPVEQVNYSDIRGSGMGVNWPSTSSVGALSFMGILRAKSGLRSLDLPTDAQWEYACRAGTSTALNSGKNLTNTSMCNNLAEVARYYYNGGNAAVQSGSTSVGSAKVGSYLPNAWGLYDMHGNIWQWCLDWYGPFSGDVTDPKGGASGVYRILRGGSWASGARDCRSADRNFVDPGYRYRDVGFRVVTTTPAYNLIIDGGSGSGEYVIGINTSVVADSAVRGQVFSSWLVSPAGADLGAGFSADQPSTVVTMPEYDVTLTAQYEAEWYTVTLDAGAGQVTPSSISVTNGMAYGVLPAATRMGYTFLGWWTGKFGSGSQVTAMTEVTAYADHGLYAKWDEDPILCPPAETDGLTATGTYDGFFYDEEAFDSADATSVRGTLSLKITGIAGKLTAKASIQKGTLSFYTGSWTSTDSNGVRRAVMSTRNGEVLDLSVSQDRVWGELRGGFLGGETLAVDGARNRFADLTDSSAQALLDGFRGYYTVALPVQEALSLGTANAAPGGSGFLTVTVGNGGKVKVAGQLADGTKVSLSSQLIVIDGCGPVASVPLFAPLYSRKGWVGGLLWIDPVSRTIVTDRDLGWFIRWERPGQGPDGFSVLLDACGGFYSAALVLSSHYLFTAETNAVPYRLNGGAADIQDAFPTDVNVMSDGARLTLAKGVKPVLVDGAYDYAGAANTSMATLSFVPATGLFKGKFNLYYDYVLSGRLQHKSVGVSYAGVFTPARSEAFADFPEGQGYYLVQDKDPSLLRYNLKRSYWVKFAAVP